MMKDFFDVTVLAVLQGVAEFLPVSSSGHLVVVQHLLEVPEPLRMRLEVFLHAGTLVSIFAFYAARLRAEAFRPENIFSLWKNYIEEIIAKRG